MKNFGTAGQWRSSILWIAAMMKAKRSGVVLGAREHESGYVHKHGNCGHWVIASLETLITNVKYVQMQKQ